MTTVTHHDTTAAGQEPHDLRARVRGDVLTPGDAGYDQARTGWNLARVSRPAIVVVAADTDDVVHAVRFAAARRMRVAVQGTGHGPGPSADGALLIVTSRLTGVEIDPLNRTARVQAGAKWGAVLTPAQEHGLAPLVGSTTDVGVVGYTLGGGMGWLARHYGLASDSVRSFDLVTPDGVELRTSPDVNPEIFWALRGGGAGTLGVITAVELELYPVSTVYGGNLFYPADAAADVLRFFREWAADLPEEMTAAVTLMNMPPVEDVPEPLRGRSFALVRGAWSGADLEAGRELVDRWRQWRAPELDLFGPMPFAQSDAISMDPVDPHAAVVDTDWLDELPDAVVDLLVGGVLPAPGRQPVLLFAELRTAGGAMRTKAAGTANERGRSGELLLHTVGLAPFPEAQYAIEAHLRGLRQQLAPYVTGAVYPNFLDGEDRRTRAPQAYAPQHLARLRQVKAALDPEDRFGFGFGFGG